jgi:uncharacterized repeat protein (TIGR02543 family)
VKFNANGGTGTMSNESFTYGTAKALTANSFTRAGYAFQGWATSADGAKAYNDNQTVSNLTTTAGAVVNLYAKWSGKLYMVIDLSSGSSSSSYPVSYLDSEPSTGWDDAYKTTKLVLRRIDPGTFNYQGITATAISKGFYMAVFELTQKQWSLVMGSSQNFYSSGDKRPANGMTSATELLSRLRTRTGFSGLNLPSEVQWEYACKAGTTTAYNNGKTLSLQNMLEVGCCYDDYHVGGVEVGLYQPNAWGLYDMHGNVYEWCTDGSSMVKRGGGWNYQYQYCTSENRDFSHPSYNSYGANYYGGVRLCLTP